MISDNESLNGYESWRILCIRYKVKASHRATGRLSQILSMKFGGIGTIEDTLAKWESELRKCESEVRSPLQDAVKLAVLMMNTTGAIQEHIRLNAAVIDNYPKAREIIINYAKAKQVLYSEPSPMDIGQLHKGKGKR
jgi:hypothetical protein